MNVIRTQPACPLCSRELESADASVTHDRRPQYFCATCTQTYVQRGDSLHPLVTVDPEPSVEQTDDGHEILLCTECDRHPRVACFEDGHELCIDCMGARLDTVTARLKLYESIQCPPELLGEVAAIIRDHGGVALALSTARKVLALPALRARVVQHILETRETT